MKKTLGIALFIAAFFSGHLFAADESITITTYYPSPYGDYKSLTTTSHTYLATAEGNVGIGTADPTAKLQVAGAIKAGNTTYNCRQQEGGQIRVDTDNNLQVCATGQGGWRWRNITYDAA